MKFLVARINDEGVVAETFPLTGKFDDREAAVTNARDRAFAHNGKYRVFEAIIDVNPVKAVDVVELDRAS